MHGLAEEGQIFQPGLPRVEGGRNEDLTNPRRSERCREHADYYRRCYSLRYCGSIF